MNFKKVIVLCGLAILLMVTAKAVFAEEAIVVPVDSKIITSNQQDPQEKENDLQWVWGEVTNLDNQANTVTLKYLDYETDQEQELVLVVDEKTTFENIKDFNALKLKDTLSVDYMIGVDNKNIAKNMSFEKPEDSSSLVLPQVDAPDLVPPTMQTEMPLNTSIVENEVSQSEGSAPVPAAQEPTPVVQGQTQ